MNDPMAALRVRFQERCREDLMLLQAADWREDAVTPEVRRAVHRLSGGAGVFGYGELSTLAARVDDALHAGQPVEPADLAALLAALEAAL